MSEMYMPAFPEGKHKTDQPGARAIAVIESRFTRGKGVEGDPVRIVVAYYALDGKLLAEFDEWAEMSEYRKADLAKKPKAKP